MANYQSIPRRFNKTTSNINHAYIDKTLKEKQSTIDSNIGFMQESIEKVLGQDFANTEDMEMLKGKLSEVMNALGNTDSIRFDSKKTRFFMQDALSQAAKDPEVLKQISNTKRIRAFQKEVQEAQKKGTFNLNNYEVAKRQAKLDAYMAKGDERDPNLGMLSYTPYYDANSEIMTKTKDIESRYEQQERVVEQDGRYVTVLTDNLEPEETREKIWASLSPQAKYQMSIDGYASMGFDTKEFDDSLDERIKTLSENKQTKIQSVKDTVGVNSSEAEVKEAEEKISALSLVYDNNITQARDVKKSKSPLNKGMHYQKNKMLNTLITDNYRNDIVVGIEETEEYKRNTKIQREKEKIQNNLSYANGAVHLAGELPKDLQGKKSERPIVYQTFDEIQSRKEKFNKEAGVSFKSFTQGQQKKLETERKNIVEAYREVGMVPDDYTINKKLLRDYGTTLLKGEEDLEAKANLKESFAILNKLADSEEEISKTYDEKYNKHYALYQGTRVGKFLEEVTSHPHIATVNENLQVVDANAEMAGLGVKTPEDIINITKGDYSGIPGYGSFTESEKSEIRKKANYLHANMLFSSKNNALNTDVQHSIGKEGRTITRRGESVRVGHNVDTSFSVEDIEEIKNALGLEGEIEDYGVVLSNGHFKYHEGTELLDFMTTASSREGAHRHETTFGDLGDVSNIFNLAGEDFEKFRRKQADDGMINMNTDNMISILPSKGSGEKMMVKVWEELKGQTDVNNGIPAVPQEHKGAVFLAKDPNNPQNLMVLLEREIKTEGVAGEYKKQNRFEKYSTIKASQITDTDFNNLVDSIEVRDRLDFIGKSDKVSNEAMYVTNRGPEHKQIYRDLTTLFPRETANRLAMMQSKENIRPFLKRTIEDLEKTDDNVERRGEARVMAEYFEQNHHKYRLNIKGNNGDYFLNLVEKDSPKDIITQIHIGKGMNLTQLETVYYKYPAAYITQLMGDAVAKQVEGISQTTKNYYKKIK